MIDYPLIMLFLSVLLLIARSFTALFHELGHAIPAILLTKEKVTVYVATDGEQNKSFRLKIGLLEGYFRFNPLSWYYRGLCVPSAKNIPISQQIIYTLTGPIASFSIAATVCYFAFYCDFHGFLKLILVIFLGSSTFDLLTNLIPRKKPVKLYDGGLAYNDGYTLKQLFRYTKFPKEFFQAIKLYNELKYQEAAPLFDDIIKKGFRSEHVYRTAIFSNWQEKNYEKARELVDEFIITSKMNTDDYAIAGAIYTQIGLYDKAMEFYDKSLEQDPDNRYSLNNKGYVLNLLNQYAEAILLFNRAIEINKFFIDPYINRGYAKIKIGKSDDGLKDLNYSFKLDKNNAYVHLNLGIYHFEMGEYDAALQLFKKAKEIDKTTHMVDELITKAELCKGK